MDREKALRLIESIIKTHAESLRDAEQDAAANVLHHAAIDIQALVNELLDDCATQVARERDRH